MKKNISINISGIIFHIEEDGYNDLKNYLESINKYFASYEDNNEIIADIESRIAEIFLTKLDDSKQIIVMEDVKALIDTMGTIADFEAVEEDVPHSEEKEEAKEKEADKKKSEEKEESNQEDPGKTRLLRDEKRRVIGGVASGIGYYLSIDPIWVRLIMVVLFLNLFFGPLSGGVFLIYIILWIIVPGSTSLGEDEHVKKMFRDSESRVLGGVASGISAYFGIDVTIVRLLFVLSIFLGGTGFIIYIIFWVITPEAKSITEKMQMQGEPVTLSNIQQSVKKSLKNEEGEESALAKVLLFPFRAIAILFEAIGKILGPFSKVILDVLRVFVGLVLITGGLAGMAGLVIGVGAAFGLFAILPEHMMASGFPIGLFVGSFSPALYVAGFILGFIPLFIMTILGISVMVKKMVIKAPLAWTVLGLWIVSIVTMGILVPATIAQFARDGDYREVRTFDMTEEPVVLRVNYLEGDHIDWRSLKLRGAEDSLFRLVLNYSSQGKTRYEAIENAKMITYGVVSTGNELIFDSNFQFQEGSVFRAQDLDITMYIPYGMKFKMENDMLNILKNTISRSDYQKWDVHEDNTWIYNSQGLVCLTCPKVSPRSDAGDKNDLDYYPSDDNDERKPETRDLVFDMEDFDEIDVRGIFNLYITQNDDYEIRMDGKAEYIDDVAVKKIGDVLEVSINKRKWELIKSLSDDQKVNLYISLPELKKISSSGFCDVTVKKFNGEELDIDFSGGSSGDLNLYFDEIEIDMDGSSKLELAGEVKYADVKMSGASALRSVDLQVDEMELKASGVSNARVLVEDKLRVDVGVMSNVKYAGDPELEVSRETGLSSVQPMK